jgi:hypothetical protein
LNLWGLTAKDAKDAKGMQQEELNHDGTTSTTKIHVNHQLTRMLQGDHSLNEESFVVSVVPLW